MNEEADRYWKEFEESTGERVEARALGQWFGSEAGEGVWGLLILTERAFHFRGQNSDNWFLGLFSGRGRKAPEPIEFSVPRESLVSLQEPRRSGLDRLFGSAFPTFTLTWRPRDPSDPGTGRFSLDNQHRFLEAIRRLFPASMPGDGNPGGVPPKS